MKITIDSVIRLRDVPVDVLKRIKSDLTLKNPDFIKKRRMGLNPYVCGPEFIKLWSERVVDDRKEYVIPRGYFAKLWNLVGLTWDMVDDKRVRLPGD